MSEQMVLVFGESRLFRDERGYFSLDRGTVGRAWTRGLDGIEGLGLAVRVEAASPVPHGASPVDVDYVAELPYYVGLRSMVRALPRLVLAVNAAVKRSDVVVSRLPGLMGLLAVAAARRHGRPVAVEVVGDVRDVLGAGTLGPVGRVAAPFLAATTRWAVRQAQAARYMTQRTLQEAYPVRQGVPTVGASSVQLDDTWLIPPESVGPTAVESPVILAIGSQEQLYKAHDTLIRAHVDVLRRHPTARLVLVGQGRMQAHLRALANESGIGDKVDFPGYVKDRDALRDLLDSCTVFCMPSRTEGLPRALVEAMARGRMCLGSHAGGIPELLSVECLFDAEDVPAWSSAICRALDAPVSRAEHGRRNAVAAQEFSPARLGERIARWRGLVTRLAERPA